MDNMLARISEILENPEAASKLKDIAASLGIMQSPSVQTSANQAPQHTANPEPQTTPMQGAVQNISGQNVNYLPQQSNIPAMTQNFEKPAGGNTDLVNSLASLLNGGSGGGGFNLDSLSSLLGGTGNKISSHLGNSDKNVALLKAIQPYMRESRAEKIESALKAMQVLKLLSNFK